MTHGSRAPQYSALQQAAGHPGRRCFRSKKSSAGAPRRPLSATVAFDDRMGMTTVGSLPGRLSERTGGGRRSLAGWGLSPPLVKPKRRSVTLLHGQRRRTFRRGSRRLVHEVRGGAADVSFVCRLAGEVAIASLVARRRAPAHQPQGNDEPSRPQVVTRQEVGSGRSCLM